VRSRVLLSGPSRPHWPSRLAEGLVREGYRANPVVYRCVRLMAEAVASLPLRCEGPGTHPLARLMAAPNPDQALPDLMDTLTEHLMTAGNAFVEITGQGEALWCLRPDTMAVITDAEGWPEGHEQRTPRGPRRLMRDPATGRLPVIHLRLGDPGDEVWGLSPLAPAAAAIDIHNAGAAWSKALIDNAARPSGALVHVSPHGEGLTEEQVQRLREELDLAHSGPANAGRPMVLDGGLDWKPMGLTPSEMDFVEARRAAAREIALAIGVPPLLLGLPGDSTHANYREANAAFWRTAVLPLTRRIAAALTRGLGRLWPEAGPATLRVDTDAVPAFAEERAAAWARIGGAAFLTDTEKRALLGLPPAPSAATTATEPTP
jgi:HK97 family phage portal protein